MGYSEPIFPGDYGDFEAYVAHVQREWDAQWKRVYTADWSGRGPPLLHAGASLGTVSARHCTGGAAGFPPAGRSAQGFWCLTHWASAVLG